MTIKSCFKDFLDYLELEKGVSPGTAYEYSLDLNLFAAFLEQHNLPLEVGEITLQHLRKFLVYLKRERNNSAATINRKLSTLKSFFSFLQYEGIYGVKNNPALQISVMKSSKKLPQILSLEECCHFLSQLKNVSAFPLRDYAMFLLFLQCGCRLHEVKELKISAVDLEEKQVRFLGKGQKERIVPLTSETCRALTSYLEVRKPVVKTDIFFLSVFGHPLSRRGIQDIFRTLAEKTGIYRPGLSVHKLRHTTLTLLLREGVDIRSLQEIAGHASISTTQIYTHVTQEEVRAKMQKHPLARLKSSLADRVEEVVGVYNCSFFNGNEYNSRKDKRKLFDGRRELL
ncbi:tyrosine-type recombinase/integrase [Candidatus Contubernalis alkaliaceticus]|uniref:tyrosine-type recombinase/integrase n=1 Tax=Candidatus Contubernalis alkaliaceticus TaxID=338645 RepID=UPI001F4C1ED9|nr:tyrosine-type recombinase/integrase [Candidatus Contubernalis alkalaceticus]UNC93574.1 tyrosine-type recombinase/integrase [Candidatus Contubernalis alkalaceticus]